MYEWNEEKRQANIAKHGFDFIHADAVLSNPHIRLASHYQGEERFLAVGQIQGRIATVIYTMRENRYRIISIRSARNDEKQAYQNLLGQ